MRLWTIHPKFLDSIGLVALWREALLAKNVLLGNTKGYKNHPQLDRFKQTDDPIGYINDYLMTVHGESLSRGFNFDFGKVQCSGKRRKRFDVTAGQVLYEWKHLQEKLKIRSPKQFETNNNIILSSQTDHETSSKLIGEQFRSTNDPNLEPWERI